MEPIGVAVIGSGYWGKNFVRVLYELADTKLLYVVDQKKTNFDMLRPRYTNTEFITEYEKVLNDDRVHAIVVATPPSTHYNIGMEVIKAGKHLLVEKPLSCEASTSMELVQQAKKAGLVLMVGFTVLFIKSVQESKRFILSPQFGIPYCMYSRRQGLGLVREDVSVVWDLVPHDLAIFCYWSETFPIKVSAVGPKYLGNKFPDSAFITLSYEGGLIANAHVSWADPQKQRESVFVSSKMRISVDDVNVTEPLRIMLLNSNDECDEILIPFVPPSEPLQTECLHFVNSIRKRKMHVGDCWGDCIASGDLALRIVAILEAIDKSIEQNGAPLEMFGHKSRGGVRGGQDQFSWEDVKSDKYKESYLGHSLNAVRPTFNCPKPNFDWWFSDKKDKAQTLKDEIAEIKRREEEKRMEALGLKPKTASSAHRKLDRVDLENLTKRGATERGENEADRVEGLGYSAAFTHKEMGIEVLPGPGDEDDETPADVKYETKAGLIQREKKESHRIKRDEKDSVIASALVKKKQQTEAKLEREEEKDRKLKKEAKKAMKLEKEKRKEKKEHKSSKESKKKKKKHEKKEEHRHRSRHDSDEEESNRDRRRHRSPDGHREYGHRYGSRERDRNRNRHDSPDHRKTHDSPNRDRSHRNEYSSDRSDRKHYHRRDADSPDRNNGPASRSRHDSLDRDIEPGNRSSYKRERDDLHDSDVDTRALKTQARDSIGQNEIDNDNENERNQRHDSDDEDN